jgi:hypothetical protein
VDLYIHSPIRLHGVMLNWLSTGTTLPYLYLFFFKGPITGLLFILPYILCLLLDQPPYFRQLKSFSILLVACNYQDSKSDIMDV